MAKQKLKQLITYDKAQKTAKQHKKPCSDCPFARTALRGWLGTMTAQEWMGAVQGEGIIDCHTTDKLCAGSAIFRANVCKSLRDPDAFELEPDRKLVFANYQEFLLHHANHIRS